MGQSMIHSCRRQRAQRVRLHSVSLAALLCLLQPSASAAQEYHFSEGPVTATWLIGGSTWNGRRQFLDVYCVDFPDAVSVRSTAEGLLNRNTISYFRVTYAKPIEAFVISSTVPRGRSDSEEFGLLWDMEQRNAAAINPPGSNKRYRVTKRDSAWGPVIAMDLVNVAVKGPGDLFPLNRSFLVSADAPPQSRTAHRMFVRGQNRFEVVAAGVPEPSTNRKSAITALEREVDKLADELVLSLQQCSPRAGD